MIGLIRPLTDQITALTYDEGETIKKLLNANKFKYVDISSFRVTRDILENSVRKDGVRRLIFMGHGSAFSLIGNEMDHISKSHKTIVDPLNIDKLELEFIYAMSCHSGRGLGVYATSKNHVKCYIGFSGPISFPKLSVPYNRRLIESISIGIRVMIEEGATAEQAVARIKEELDKAYRELQPGIMDILGAQDWTDNVIVAAIYRDVYNYPVVLGDKDYKLK